ncbi:MAG: hypothetical protein ABR63_01885 [SAR86 cluster bacterium BACL1 MAG-120920-bin57]|uniref:Heme chaperone HemW n=2 Tax=SAR86 cluster TaxID=62672 RepID=A0A0R2UFW2_9GAMM|nr:MAG: hypothetical protein ABR59_07150 [SAR86 cluster bacterium BACL1 MAG-120507-bin14]KRO39742.1 MAG: hypothetical protein ABR63_01885 [SAR86 cluster bacterium BACL1 MAG-120920-bin57]KRO96128.1 MAG: hypothetical protein ABS10_06015 [SAR86 cluster bacterium BACL1 MAG-120820-bin45]KRO96989.1 MAG: hypothetical protein ABS11_01510 [SAR86 cluster bacterium BACL1 MAG-120828-bin5]KRO99108.1 MAG: hypothetical protein ABS15_05745 [SAR86 cluster bacterium BACL1 MAG-120823-bin87]KRP00135.1 MAG: hypoth
MSLSKPPLSLYIHLPWCEVQCPYCDFSITTEPVKQNDQKLAHAIAQDLEDSAALIDGREFSSVYFGGGTPSLASAEAIAIILDAVKQNPLSKEMEITFEMNPRDVSANKLSDLSALGINRYSLGVQSYNDPELKGLGRNHDKASGIEATNLLKGMNSTIDLIYGTEYQTATSFQETLEQFIDSQTNHLSLYQLTIEPNTIFYKKELKLPNEDQIEGMERLARQMLESNGYQQYEVSSWSRPGFESRHNLNYWQFGDFLGLGPGAHSKITVGPEITRFRKIKPLNGYIAKQTIADHTIIQGEELDMDLAMNLLRIKDGILPDHLGVELPKSFLKKYQLGVKEGLLLEDKIGATARGYQYLNETIKLFF